ncbi:MAG: response regulator [Saprospiraceae bacterium]|nr:response regulator [Saprospiraceae bacterium]
MPQLIISDLMMPKMDGYQLLNKLKSDDRFRGIPIIILTAKVSSDEKLKALRIGIDDYLTKPFNVEDLDKGIYLVKVDMDGKTNWERVIIQ